MTDITVHWAKDEIHAQLPTGSFFVFKRMDDLDVFICLVCVPLRVIQGVREILGDEYTCEYDEILPHTVIVGRP